MGILQWFQNRWSSNNPRKRYIGFLGKLVFEDGVGLLVGVIIGGVIFGIDMLVTEILIFSSFERGMATIVIPVGGYLATRLHCNVILDERTLSEEEQTRQATLKESVEETDDDCGEMENV